MVSIIRDFSILASCNSRFSLPSCLHKWSGVPGSEEVCGEVIGAQPVRLPKSITIPAGGSEIKSSGLWLLDCRCVVELFPQALSRRCSSHESIRRDPFWDRNRLRNDLAKWSELI